MDCKEYRPLLAEAEAFASAPVEALDLLLESAEVKTISEGETLIQKGASGESIWMLLEGELVVDVGGQLANELSDRGVVVGEISAVSQTPATATVRSKKEGSALCIPQEALHKAMFEFPDLAGSMLRSMAKYLGRL